MADPRVSRALTGMAERGQPRGAQHVLASARAARPTDDAGADLGSGTGHRVWLAFVALAAILVLVVGLRTRTSSPATSVDAAAPSGATAGGDGLRLLPAEVPAGLVLSSVSVGTAGTTSPMTVSGIVRAGAVTASVTALKADGGPQEWLAPRPANAGAPTTKVLTAVMSDPMQLSLNVVAVDDPAMGRILVIGRAVDPRQLSTIAAGVTAPTGSLVFDPGTLPAGFQPLYAGTSEMYNLVLGSAEESLQYTAATPADDPGRRLDIQASRLQHFDPNAIAWLFPSATTADGRSLSASFGRKQIYLAEKEGIAVAVTSHGAGSAQSVFTGIDIATPDRWSAETENLKRPSTAVATPGS